MAVWILAACVLAPEPAVSLKPGDELLYRGAAVEECVRVDMPSQRQFQISLRILVLAERDGHFDLAFLSLVRAEDNAAIAQAGLDTKATKTVSPPAVRLALLRLDRFGGLTQLEPPTAPPPVDFGKNLPTRRLAALPLDTINDLDLGAFPPRPPRWEPGTAWTDDSETLRPPLRLTVQPPILLDGAEVRELSGVQQSENWEKPIPTDRPWRRSERVWISPADGLARIVWRRIERRDGHQPAFRIETRLDLHPCPPLRGGQFTAARRDLETAWYYERLLAVTPAEDRDPLRARIERYCRDYPATDWRIALDAVARRLAP